MLCKVVVSFLLVCTLAEASTRIRFNNYCNQSVAVTDRQYNDERNVICNLTAGSSCYNDYSLVWEGEYFQNGASDNATIVYVCFNCSYLDYYTIHLFNGAYDLPVSVSANNGGLTITCYDKTCPDDYEKNTGVVASTNTGGAITLDFCPDSAGSFAKKLGHKGLPLVEAAHSPPKTKSSTVKLNPLDKIIGNRKSNKV